MSTTTKTDTTVLGRNWMLNDDDSALKAAIKSLQFELDQRDHRREVSELAKRRSAERTAEVANEIRAIESQFTEGEDR